MYKMKRYFVWLPVIFFGDFQWQNVSTCKNSLHDKKKTFFQGWARRQSRFQDLLLTLQERQVSLVDETAT